jgi:hypothetical protein
MGSMLKLIPLWFLFLSCGTLRSDKIDSMLSVDQRLVAVPMEGEGRGRVGLRGKNFVFSYDAILKEGDHWILSATVPLHGEEVMSFTNLRSSESLATGESFERRIATMFQEEVPGLISSEQVIQELRSLIRFMLSAKLALKRECQKHEEFYECKVTNQQGSYTVKELSQNKLLVSKQLTADAIVSLEGENFHGGRFLRTNFYFISKQERIFSLELLWK